jgi:hypothetical protein
MRLGQWRGGGVLPPKEGEVGWTGGFGIHGHAGTSRERSTRFAPPEPPPKMTREEETPWERAQE